MSSTRPADPAAAVESDRRPVAASRWLRRRERNGTGVFGQGASLLARAVQLVASVIVAIIVAGILLVVLKANPANSIVSEVHSWAQWLAGPFDGMFSFNSPRAAIAVNWGIAGVVYLFVGVTITRLIGGTRGYPLARSSTSSGDVL
jgi:hypothetical protein